MPINYNNNYNNNNNNNNNSNDDNINNTNVITSAPTIATPKNIGIDNIQQGKQPTPASIVSETENIVIEQTKCIKQPQQNPVDNEEADNDQETNKNVQWEHLYQPLNWKCVETNRYFSNEIELSNYLFESDKYENLQILNLI